MNGRVCVRTVSGPLTGFAPGFELWLAARGFSPSAVRHRRWLFDHLNRWLGLEGLGAADLTAERAEQFLRAAIYAKVDREALREIARPWPAA